LVTVAANAFVAPAVTGSHLRFDDRDIEHVAGCQELRVLAFLAKAFVGWVLPNVVGLEAARLRDGGR
jgi:hypothetical protein